MAKGNEEITARAVYSRLARKLVRPGVLPALIKSRRLTPETRDSLGLRLEVAAETWPGLPSVRFEERVLTWQQVNEATNRHAHALLDLGIRNGDVVVVDVSNRPEMLFVMMALMKVGAVSALVNTGLTGASLAHSIRVVEPRAVVAGEEQLGSLGTVGDLEDLCDTWMLVRDGGTPELPDGWIDLDAAAAGASTANPSTTADIALGTPAVYIYTSGTTGLPKAAVGPHTRLRMGGMLIGKMVLEIGPDDVMYCPLPLYHSTGLMGAWASCVHTGAAMALARKFSASTFWDDIRRHGATSFNYVGEVLRFLMNQPPSAKDRDHRVRAIYGAGLRPEVWDEFKERFGIEYVHEVWGASESPNGFLNLLNFDKTVGWNPTGWRIVPYDHEREAPVRGADGFMEPVGPGGTGLLIMKIDEHQRFEGYTDDDATEAKILRDVFKPGDRWFDSGDLMVNLGHGHARFADRLGDTYRWRGENVATTEVEGVAGAWHQVDLAVAYGVEVPGHEGRCGMLMVNVADGQDLDLDGFAKHLRANLPTYAVPRFLRVAQGVAVTGTYKVQKFDLKYEGFDPDVVSDPLHLLAPDDETFRPLHREVLEGVAAGDVRL